MLCWGDAAGDKLGNLATLTARRRAGLVFVTSSLPVGATQMNGSFVNYSGHNLYGVSSAAEQVTVRPRAAVALTSSKPSAVYGEDVTLTAQVTANDGSTPQGTPIFYRDGVWADAVDLDAQGKASMVAKFRDAGGYDWYAYYNGSESWSRATSPTLRQTWAVAPTTTVVAASVTPPVYGQPDRFTATVAATPASVPKGDVTFKLDGVTQATVPLAGGTAGWSTTKLVGGAHTVTASFAGGVNHRPSNGELVVNAETETVTTVAYSTTPVRYGQKVSMTVTVVGRDGKAPTEGTVYIEKPNSYSYGRGAIGARGGARDRLRQCL